MLKIKLLPLILILFLSFTLIGNCADWLPGWDYRIEITLPDYAGDFGGAVTWFPVDVFLTATQAEEVFAELTADIEYKKIQFTQADGTSLLYGHMKTFDVSETKGVFAVSATGWTIDANTSIFLYYDKDHADNNTYIGATNTSACENVYNAEYIAVYPMDDGADTSNIYDATSNNNDGVKTGAGQPNEIAGKVGQAQEFDGIDDFINCGHDSSIDTLSQITIEVWTKTADVWGDSEGIVVRRDGSNEIWLLQHSGTDRFYFQIYPASGGYEDVVSSTSRSVGIWYYVVAVYDGTDIRIYVNGALDSTPQSNISGNVKSGITDLWIGKWYTVDYCFEGTNDEVRLSNTGRNAAWIKGTYNSAEDDLFTYGSEEVPPVEAAANIMFMFGEF